MTVHWSIALRDTPHLFVCTSPPTWMEFGVEVTGKPEDQPWDKPTVRVFFPWTSIKAMYRT